LENVVEISIKPVVAIGGINLDNCVPIINSGVNAIAMINALYSTDKVSNKILEIKRKFING
jgi:thiamine-phosphate pyrophosphorylase